MISLKEPLEDQKNLVKKFFINKKLPFCFQNEKFASTGMTGLSGLIGALEQPLNKVPWV